MTIGINLNGINPNGILMMIGISLLGSMNGGDGLAAVVVVHHHRVNQERAGLNLAVVAVVHPQVIGIGMVPRGRGHRVGMNQCGIVGVNDRHGITNHLGLGDGQVVAAAHDLVNLERVGVNEC